MAPYFLLAILIQVILSRSLGTGFIRFDGRKEPVAILIAALVGIVSPLPTYVAVPIGISLLAIGASLSAVVTFAIASPLLNPSVFYFTLAQLGLKIALLRIATTLILAIGGGILARWVLQSIDVRMPDYSQGQDKSHRPFWMDMYRSTLFLGRYFLIALLVSAMVKALVSPDWIARVLGEQGHQGIVIAMALGVPFYSCGGAAIPLIEVLRTMGMSDGAVLAFFIAGPATKLETLYIYKSMLGMKTLIFYLAVTFLGAYLSGILVLLFFP
ncbi:MAG: permease [Candidatus Marinimicrobia bacterium]|nr:permease [Candidatus Neomarinimicrobiota bacterium]MCF7827614.1 permease [Candidatus Neomarinimicrobiota bacterium]MCF7881331.1 permease [Candidatus Neomarinimicrobiota bacterium]